MNLEKDWSICRKEIQNLMQHYFSEDDRLLKKSMLYTLEQGKKFRPFLSYATAKVFGENINEIYPYALAVEMVHAFSLVHDDLPALDNDDERRGLATNHKKFGEDVAILAGDALLNEANLLISKSYKNKPKLALDLIEELALAVGRDGMIEGQIQDLKAQKNKIDIKDLKQVHLLKTACLIEASVVGAAKIMSASKEEISSLRDYSKNLGLAFQIADDLLEEENEIGSYVYLLGREEAKKELAKVSAGARESLKAFDNAHLLKALVEENEFRKK